MKKCLSEEETAESDSGESTDESSEWREVRRSGDEHSPAAGSGGYGCRSADDVPSSKRRRHGLTTYATDSNRFAAPLISL